MNRPLDLRIRERDWDRLTQHLFPGDRDEHGAALLCGYVETARTRRLLVREVILAEDGLDYVAGKRGYRHLTGAFVTRQIRKAKDEGLIYLAVHNHSGTDQVDFSTDDLDSHERAYPTLLQVSGMPVGGVVVAKQALAGDIWLPDGSRASVRTTTLVGDAMTVFEKSPSENLTFPERYQRQSLIFGEPGQALLGGIRVGIVGAGGVGMLVVQALSRLGVGELMVVDPDRVSSTNLSRLPEATRRDAMEWFDKPSTPRPIRRLTSYLRRKKIRLAARIAARANSEVRVIAIDGDVADESVASQLRDCDFIFLAADTMLARDVINQMSYQYIIPTLQVGSKVVVDAETGQVRDVFGVVRSLGAEPGCLRCNGLINMARLTEESLASEIQRANQRYVDDPNVHAPSVITLNMMSTGWAVNDFMHYVVGIGRPSTGFRILRSKPLSGQPQLTTQTPHADPHCYVCGQTAASALSQGDYVDLPTRSR